MGWPAADGPRQIGRCQRHCGHDIFRIRNAPARRHLTAGIKSVGKIRVPSARTREVIHRGGNPVDGQVGRRQSRQRTAKAVAGEIQRHESKSLSLGDQRSELLVPRTQIPGCILELLVSQFHQGGCFPGDKLAESGWKYP